MMGKPEQTDLGFRGLVETHGIARVILALGAIPVAFALGFKSWLGDLGFLMLKPEALFTLSVDLGQVVVWVVMLRIVMLLAVDGIGLIIARVKAAIKKTEVQPHEEPLSKSEEFWINTVGTILFVLFLYAPSASIYLVVGLLVWILCRKFGGLGFVDPSGIGLSPKAAEWNRKMIIMSALAVIYGGAYAVGLGRAEKLSNGEQVGVAINGDLKPFVVVLQVGDGSILFDRASGEPLFIAKPAITGFQKWEIGEEEPKKSSAH